MTHSENENTSERSRRNSRTNRPQEFQVDYLTLQDALNLGEQASRALKNQSVELGLQMAMRQLQNEWADSKPEEVKKRDFLYREMQALKRVWFSLEGFIAQAQNLHNQQEQLAAQDYAESQY